MAKKISSSGISNGSRITASQLKQITDALSSAEVYSIQITGSLSITGSSEIQGSLTAVSMSGEGSGITGVVSSSYAVSSSHALTSISSSYAVSSSVTVITEISSSFSTSASRADSAAAVEFINITGKPTLVSGSSQIDLSSATGKAALATTADTASYVAAGNIDGTVATAASANAVAFVNITGKPTLVSGSSQIDLGSATGTAANATSASRAVSADSADAVAFTNVTGKPTLVSGSSQIDLSSATGIATNAATASYIDSVNINQPFSSITASGDINANNINLVGEISSSTSDVASNAYIGGDLQVSGSVTSSALNLYGVDYKPWMLLGSAWFNAGVNLSGDKIGPDWKNATSAEPWPASSYPFQIYWNPDLVDISGQGNIEMSVRVLADQDNANGFYFGLFDGTDGFLSASLSSPWTQRTDTTLGWTTATISGSDFSGKAFTNTSTDRILEFQAFSADSGNYFGIYAIQIYAKKI